MKHSLSVRVWIRCALGVAVILGVVAIATGWETSFIRFSFIDTVSAQEHLIGAFHSESRLFLQRALPSLSLPLLMRDPA